MSDLHAPDFSSERLDYRLLTDSAADFRALRLLQSNPDFMRFITGGVTRTEEQTRIAFEKALRFSIERPGLGIFLANERATGAFVGQALLRVPAFDCPSGSVELGYGFLPEYWGRGFATESSRRFVSRAFDELGIETLVALIDPDHAVSRRVLEKLGFGSPRRVPYRDLVTGEEVAAESLDLQRAGVRKT